MDYATLCYLMSEKESKARYEMGAFIARFDIDIQDKKGSENEVADHLSRLEENGRPHDDLEINDSFPDEQLLELSMKEICTDGVIRRYVLDEEQRDILGAVHSSPHGGHHKEQERRQRY
ncbi:uncharacterized protein [Nicotiana tomentosiformis]|uniref:uncharacterized protein n=1 Tax=Nicotiana tomentosiformis TaxID=4098 RepID=UPI00388C5D8A